MPFSSIILDHVVAQKRLEAALKTGKAITSPVSKYRIKIKQVITGSHLTYRYILVTNLLAKATNPRINALALQVGADFDGAFDSRSLCHKVLVPFERDYLGGRLGRSNEPYLNKPARHKSLSEDNAVRKGNDRVLLEACIEVLSQCSQKEAFEGLSDAIHFTLNLASIQDNLVNATRKSTAQDHLQKFAAILLQSSNEGQNCALLAGLAFHFLSNSFKAVWDIRIHPVNQSGASSKEVLDVDVYYKDVIRFTAEIKDKNFTREDVDHAANKVKSAGHNAMFFVTGPNARTTLTAEQIAAIGDALDVRIAVLPVAHFYTMALGLCADSVSVALAWQTIVRICQEARMKQTTQNTVQEAAISAGLIEVKKKDIDISPEAA